MRSHSHCRIVQSIALMALLIINSQLSTALAQGTRFTYNGVLQQGGVLPSGTYNFMFTLYDTLGTKIAGPFTTNGVPVTTGAFTVTMDFGGAVWDGHTNWLEIEVEGPGEVTFTTLAPRQQVMPTPYAIFATTASNLSGTLPAAQLTGPIYNNQLANGSITIGTGPGLSPGGTVALGSSITLNNTGVTSLTGGDGVTVSGATGDLTLGLGTTLSLTGTLPVVMNTQGRSLLYADNNGNYFNGIGAGYPATSGSANTAVGLNALAENNSGSDNTANGAYTLASNTSGSDNTANGWSALFDNQSGSYNVGDGAGTLQFNWSGNNNTAVGGAALGLLGQMPLAGGTNNIAIGFEAGSAYNGNESSNIDIGNFGVTGESGVTRIGTSGIQTTAYIAGTITGDGSGLVNLNASQITSGAINSSLLANSPITVNTGPGLSSSGSPVALGGMINLYNTGVTSLTGGDGVTVSAATGNLTLGLGSTLTLANLPAAIEAQGSTLLYMDNNGDYFAGLSVGTPGAGGGANTATGAYALGGNSSGGANTAYGFGALQDNKSGSSNTAEGYGALSLNQTGTGNTANGAYAIYESTSGSYNVASGMYALLNNGGGSYNTANGMRALQGNQGGSYNVGDGASALEFNRNGTYNTALGYSALSELGQLSGQGGSNNIAIGNGAGSAFQGIESSNIDIGNIGVLGESDITRIGTPGIQTAAYIAGIINGDGSGLVNLNGSQITSGSISSSLLANSPITVVTSPGSGLSGGQSVALGGTITLNNTGVTSLTGSDGVTVSGATGNLTLGLGSTLTLQNLPVAVNTGNGSLLYADNNDNYFAGLGAGNPSTSGVDNTGCGAFALQNIGSGQCNTAYGFEALVQNSVGSQNTAEGFFALRGNGTGNYNTANGAYALSENGSGSYNTAAGMYALSGNVDGSGDTAAGMYALASNSSGSGNVANGMGALQGNDVGSGNVADGAGALGANNGGNNNTAVGSSALGLLGQLALHQGGTNNIAVGYEAGSAFSRNESSNIDIGNIGVAGESGITRIGTSGIQTAAYIAGIINGNGSGLTSLNGSQITSGTINDSLLASSSIIVTTGSSGITGGTTVPLGGTLALGLGTTLTMTGGMPVSINTQGTSLLYDDFSENFFAGLAAGPRTPSSGGGNTAAGNIAFQNNTSGSGNAAFGYEALLSNTSGSWNTAVGAAALFGNTTGYYNVAVGWDALTSSTIGYQNTAVGYESLYQNTTGINNSAVGEQALYANTTGGANTATGVLSMSGNTTGSANTADGQQALYSNQSGGDNTAVGFQSLYSDASTGNTAVGRSALYSSTGNYNIGIGDYAGQSLTTGNNNIDIGNYGSAGDDSIIRIGTPGTQTDAYIAGLCKSAEGYCCQQGINGPSYGNTFNFWWSGSELDAWIDFTDVGAVFLTSDRRVKEDIQPMTDDALTRVMALKPSTFKYKNIPGTIFHGDGQTKEGFIADELQQVIPSAVNGQKDGLTSKGTIQPQTLNLMPVVAVLTKAVQDQQIQMQAQQKEIDELKAMVMTLSERK